MQSGQTKSSYSDSSRMQGFRTINQKKKKRWRDESKQRNILLSAFPKNEQTNLIFFLM